jgi:glycosyltransferase involved in cell wall biosynthesis
MNKFDIDVIITCKDKEKYLKECIDSVLQQTWKPKSIILVHDDCQQPQSYTHCRTIILPENKGVCYARDVGVKNTNGHFLLFLDGDDKLAPDYIQRGIQANSEIVYSDVLTWFEYDGSISKRDNELHKTPARLTVDLLWKQCQILISSIMTRKVYERIGGFREYPIFEDWDFWLRCMAQNFKFKKFQSLLYYRQSPNTRNQNPKEYRRKIAAKIKANFVYKKENKKSILKEMRFLKNVCP